MADHRFQGGCSRTTGRSDTVPIGNPVCLCKACWNVPGQNASHVVITNHCADRASSDGQITCVSLKAESPDGLPAISQKDNCEAVQVPDGHMKRVRVAVPNALNFSLAHATPDFRGFPGEMKANPKPADGRPDYYGIRPDFVRPQGA